MQKKRIEDLEARLDNMCKHEAPDLVFIAAEKNGFRVIEDYFKRDSKGDIVKGMKRKTYTTEEPLDTITKQYGERTTVLKGNITE